MVTEMYKMGDYRFPAATWMGTGSSSAGRSRNVNNLFMGRNYAGVINRNMDCILPVALRKDPGQSPREGCHQLGLCDRMTVKGPIYGFPVGSWLRDIHIHSVEREDVVV